MSKSNTPVAKAYAITDAKISFVSLVNKAANKHQFLIVKAQDGKAQFRSYGDILKADADKHEVTGIVYEPMVEDTQNNYMTAEEIEKAAHWFMKNQGKVDLQHDFDPLDGACAVESYVTKCDETIGDQAVKKGTWVMTVEVSDPDIFESIEKGEITGFSMGGLGKYSEEDVDLGMVEESEEPTEKQKHSILKAIAKALGISTDSTQKPAPVAKGAVMENYLNRSVRDNFWNAFYALQSQLIKYNSWEDKDELQTDPQVITDSLEEFSQIVTSILSANSEAVAKSADTENLPVMQVMKAGKAMSKKNVATLKGIASSLGDFISSFEQEDEEVTKEEITSVVKAAVAEALKPQSAKPAPAEGEPVAKSDDQPITKADVQKMIEEAIRKATGEETEPTPAEGDDVISEAELEGMVEKAVQKAMDTFMKQSGNPTNLNGSVQKNDAGEEHYLHGIL